MSNRLRNKLDSIIPRYDNCSDNDVDYLERCIDNFAVKFADWKDTNFWKIDYIEQETHTTTELLQIFKDKYYE